MWEVMLFLFMRCGGVHDIVAVVAAEDKREGPGKPKLELTSELKPG